MQLQTGFIKHYDPNHMFAPKENTYHLSLLALIEKRQKRNIAQSIMYGIYSNFIQIIYSLNTNCVLNVMITAQVVNQRFCQQCSLLLKCIRLKRGIIQSNIHKILRNVNLVICIMCPNSMPPDIMVLAQAVLQMFCLQDCFPIQNAKVGKRRSFSQIFTELSQKLIRSSTAWTQYVSQISSS